MKTSTIQRCFTDFEGRAPSENELDFLDNFIRSRASLASGHSATSVCTNDEEVAKTLKDLLEKRARLYPDYSRPCTLKEVFLIGGEATSFGKAQSFSMAEHKLFSAENNLLARLDATLKGFTPIISKNGICTAQNQYLPIKSKSIRASKRYSITIAHSSDEDSLLNFAQKIAASKRYISCFASKGDEVFCKICEYSRSLTISSDSLTSLDGYAVVVFSKPKKAKKIISIAKNCGLDTCSGIKISKDNRLRMTRDGTEEFSFKSVILRGAMGAAAKDITLPDQAPASQIPVADKLCELSESNEQVYMTSVSLDDGHAFSGSIAAVISPLVAAVYDGLNTQNSEFSISVNASLSSGSLASILGLYRAIAELDISVENPHLSITEGQDSISVALRAHSFKERASFTISLSPDEMLKKLIGNNILPDFETLRTIINGKNA